jgi:CRISPR system Cascade subunit CasE
VIVLSQLAVDPRARAVRRDLADCHQLHRSIMSAFPGVGVEGRAARAECGVLYRVEPPAPEGHLIFLVQSTVLPDWSRLPEGYLLRRDRHGESPRVKRVEQCYDHIAPGQRLRFRLQANPTRRVARQSDPAGGSRPGRRVAVRGEAATVAWLRRKGEGAGFGLEAVRLAPAVPDLVSRSGRILGWRSDGGGSPAHRLTFDTVLFEGILRVADAGRLRAALVAGIGRGLAYGCGLVSVAAASASADA